MKTIKVVGELLAEDEFIDPTVIQPAARIVIGRFIWDDSGEVVFKILNGYAVSGNGNLVKYPEDDDLKIA